LKAGQAARGIKVKGGGDGTFKKNKKTPKKGSTVLTMRGDTIERGEKPNHQKNKAQDSFHCGQQGSEKQKFQNKNIRKPGGRFKKFWKKRERRGASVQFHEK